MDRYHLYLDESETHNNGTNRVFCLAGIIVKENEVPALETSLNNLKSQIWTGFPNPTNLILHEKEVRAATKGQNSVKNSKPEYRIFRKNSNVKALYTGLGDIINDRACTVIGAAIKKDELAQYFKPNITSPEYLIAMQIILENYCHFLESVNGVGKVFYESVDAHDRQHNARVKMHFHQIKAMGSMYVNAFAMQRYLGEIEFPSKQVNTAGLQVADFVPNVFARSTLGLPKHKPSIYDVLRKSRYDGNLMKHNRFGIKVMP